MRVTGEGGRICMGYQSAARLGGWTLSRIQTEPEQVYDLRAQLLDVDDYWISQRPLDLELQMAQRKWVWPNVEPNISNESLSATLTGAPTIH